MANENESEGGALSNFFWGAVDVAGRIAQGAQGVGEVAFGTVLAGVGVVAEVPTAGVSTMAVLGGAAVGAHGLDQIQAAIRGVPSVSNQLGTLAGNAISGPWGGVICGVLGDIGPVGIGALAKGAAAGAKSLGQFFKNMREAGGLKELLSKMRQAKQLTTLLKSGKLSPEEIAELLKNGELTLDDLRAAGIDPPPPGVLVSKAPGRTVSISPQRRTHILDGDGTGGGHRPGTGLSGKSEFPAGWSDDKIIDNVLDVARDSASRVTPGRGGRMIVEGTREGIDILTVLESDGSVVTGYPTNIPRNPR